MLKALKVLSCRGNGQHRLEAKASLSISITKEKKGSSFQKHQRSAVTDGSSLPNKNKFLLADQGRNSKHSFMKKNLVSIAMFLPQAVHLHR